MRLAIAWIATLSLAVAVTARSDERKGYEQLRLIGQYAAAADVAQSRLDRSDLAPRERAEWCVNYIRARTEQALDTLPDRRDAVWRDAQREAASFVERNPSNPALLLVHVQSALSLLARGESGALESRLLPKEVVSTEAVRHDLTAAITAMEKAMRGVAAELAALDRKKPPAGGLSREELASLEKHLRLHLARAYRTLAEGFATNAPDAIDAAQQAREQLEPLLALPPASSLGWRARVEEARLLVTETKGNEALSRLDDLARAKLPAEAIAQIDAQRMRSLLVQGQVGDAVRLSRDSSSDHAPAELQLARLEAIVQALFMAQRPSETDSLSVEVIGIMNNIATHSPSWRRRAELIVAPAALHDAALSQAASPELLALRSIRDGKIDDAIAAYDRASAKATQEKDIHRLFAATMAAARLEAGERRLEAASKRSRDVAVEHSNNERAPTTHLWAIEYARQQLQADKQAAPEALEEFRKLLTEHVERWPGETGDVVRSVQKLISE